MTTEPDIPRKARYHHGDLREALILATRQLLVERGAENFSLSDACRLAGVSTAAPYKHFRDKDEILQHIVMQGFDDLAAKSIAAASTAGEGTLAAITSMGIAYLEFARRETAVFRLMFGHNAAIKQAEAVELCGRTCFANVIAQVSLYCERNNLSADAPAIALSLWTFVHGAASLDIDKDYDKVAPGLDVSALLARATSQLLSSKLL